MFTWVEYLKILIMMCFTRQWPIPIDKKGVNGPFSPTLLERILCTSGLCLINKIHILIFVVSFVKWIDNFKFFEKSTVTFSQYYISTYYFEESILLMHINKPKTCIVGIMPIKITFSLCVGRTTSMHKDSNYPYCKRYIATYVERIYTNYFKRCSI